MRIETFFEKFDLLAATSNCVAKMRELVLQLAVQGRLCPQVEADGTADTLLQEIAASNGSEWVPGVYEPNDPPLSTLPANWRWAPTSALMDLQTGKRMKGGARDSGVISLGGEHVSPDGSVDYSVPRYITEEFFAAMTSGRVERHDTLMVKDGATTGKTAFVDHLPECGRAAVNEHVFVMRWHQPINKRCAFYFVRALAAAHIATKSAGVIGGIRRDAILELPFPLPPINEQDRIVAKVDELMALCSQLETLQRDRGAQHAALAAASLQDFFADPSRDTCESLFHDAIAVGPSELRQAILTLAVQGKLVSQQQEDESGEELLQRVWSSTASGSTRTCLNPERARRDLPFVLPRGWSVSKLGDLLEKARGISYGVIKLGPEPSEDGVFILRCSNVRFRHIDLAGVRKISQRLSAEYGRTILQGGEVLINVRGTLGGCAIVPPELRGYNIAREVAVIPVHPELDSRYILNVIASPYFQDQVAENLRGIAYRGLNLGLLREFLVPIPPIAEQRLIVAKVEELMELVDRLQADLAATSDTGERLMEAVVAELTTEN